jgi:hypothetical protein
MWMVKKELVLMVVIGWLHVGGGRAGRRGGRAGRRGVKR